MNFVERGVGVDLDGQRDFEHLAVCRKDPGVLFDLLSIFVATQNMLELHSFLQVIEALSILKDSLLLQRIRNEAIHLSCDLDLLAHPVENLPLDGVHDGLYLQDLLLSLVHFFVGVEVEARTNPLEEPVVDKAVKSRIIILDVFDMF